MPDINGTFTSNEVIDVTNDVGTLDGAPQGSPIDDINLQGADTTVTLSNSDIQDVTQGFGEYTLTATNSSINSITNGNDNATLNLTSTDITGTITGDAGSFDITWNGGTLGSDINLGSGNNLLNFDNVNINGSTTNFGNGENVLTLTDSIISAGHSITFGSGGNTVEITGTTAFGAGSSISSGPGPDTLTLPTGSVITIGGISYTVGTDTLPSSFDMNGTVDLPNGSDFAFSGFDGFAASTPVCLAIGTLIKTRNGSIPVEDLQDGDEIQTIEGDYLPLIWKGRTQAKQRLQPPFQPIHRGGSW